METSPSWWRNCAQEPDTEMLEIDAMADDFAPIASDALRIRELISTLEMCHHKAERWVDNIIDAIGEGRTTKGLGTRSRRQAHPIEHVWQAACDALAAWCAGCPSTMIDTSLGAVPGSELLAPVGERSPLKEWQVQRIIDRVRSFIRWPQAPDDIVTQYGWIMDVGDDYEPMHATGCPPSFSEHGDFWSATVATIIHNMADGVKKQLSLAVAIDLLMPCHWNFVENLRVVLSAIGGNLEPVTPYSACAMNIELRPIRGRMRTLSNSLQVFWASAEPEGELDRGVLSLLGEPTDAKKWLAASLDKTIRLQLYL